MVGNVVLWKPSPAATYSNYLVHHILVEAGLPAGVIQFVPGPPAEVVGQAIDHKEFASLHFTGSTHIFRELWKKIANNIDKYRTYPRIVGETGGKNFHLVHESADVPSCVIQAIRSAFEYQGQKCSALSRLYVPQSMWNAKGGFKEQLVAQVNAIKLGDVMDFENFGGPDIGRPAFDKITSIIAEAKSQGDSIIAGGGSDDSRGFFIQPTVIENKNPNSLTMETEIFGPVLTVYAYPDGEFEEICEIIDKSSAYALTGAVFAKERNVLVLASNKLRNCAGNFYVRLYLRLYH